VKPAVALRAALVRAGFAAGRLRPLAPFVVLATAHTDQVSGNLAWIRDHLRATRPDIRVVELAWRPGRGRTRLLGASRYALRAGWLLARARLFVVDDYYFPMYVIRPRPGSTFVQVWHACGAFKKFGYSVLDKSFGADEAYVRAVAIHSNYDLCLVSAQRFAGAYAEAFGQPLGLFSARLGIPRTDLFFDAARIERAAAAVRARYRIPDGRRVVLYAPTFRGESVSRARTPTDLDLEAMREVLGADHVVLLRSHPFVRERLTPSGNLAEFVIDVSDHPDMNELMLVADVLVTDYSSAIYEFALLGRPMAFFAPDHEAYERERGFYFEYRTGVPGPIFTDSRALAEHLRAADFDLERVRRFAAESFDVADGRATQRFVEEVALPALQEVAPRV
jgi:CDP-ribitol ribitolphosphotransferase